MNTTVARLRAFLSALKARKDIEVTAEEFDEPADPALLAKLTHLPQDLHAIWREHSWINVAWRFVDGTGGGGVMIVRANTGTDDEQESEMLFGDPKRGFAVEINIPEGMTWMELTPDTAPGYKLHFVGPDPDPDDLIAMGTSLDEFVRRGIENGFVHYWPLAEREKSAAEAIERYRKGA